MGTPRDGAPGSNRIDQARKLMETSAVDLLAVGPSSDLRYLTGYTGHASERPTLLILGSDFPPSLLIPQFEAPRAMHLEDLRLIPWDETQDPFRVLASAIPKIGAGTAAVSDQTWARVLLGLQLALPESRFISATPLMRELRMRKTSRELELLARAGAMADAAFGGLVELRFAGRTERQVGMELNQLLRDVGLMVGEGGPIVASGPNGASPHHITGEREIHEGDAVVLDFGGTVESYFADITRTVHVGTPGDEFRHVYEIVRQAQDAGVGSARPGVSAGSVDAAARGVTHAAGYEDFFIHRTGHGIGLDGHEEPYIVAGNDLALEPGMTFSVEPGIYLPGKFGVRIEDIVAVTENSSQRLNNATRELVVVR